MQHPEHQADVGQTPHDEGKQAQGTDCANRANLGTQGNSRRAHLPEKKSGPIQASMATMRQTGWQKRPPTPRCPLAHMSHMEIAHEGMAWPSIREEIPDTTAPAFGPRFPAHRWRQAANMTADINYTNTI